MIGFYNYSVIVTYIGVALSVSGMALASTGQFKFAILCLALAGACDTFDGKIARAMKNRTKEMEIFGIQIDSLCDMVCFGVTPVIISYHKYPLFFYSVFLLLSVTVKCVIKETIPLTITRM